MTPSAPGHQQGPLPISQDGHVPQKISSPPVRGQASVPRNTKNRVSPSSSFNARRITTQTSFGYPPPMEATLFQSYLPKFWRNKGIQFKNKKLKVNGQSIQPAAFHALVIQAGGFENVNATKVWGTIGRRLNVLKHPGRQLEPDTEAVEKLAYIYREYFLDLELHWVRAWNACHQKKPGSSQNLVPLSLQVVQEGRAGRSLCYGLLFQILNDKEKRAQVLQLQGNDAHTLVDYLDLVCRHKYFPEESDRRHALSLLGKLAKSSGTSPQHRFLQGVKCHPEPVAGGGSCEVFRGEYKEKLVCIKAIRAYQKQEIEEILKNNVQELILWAHLEHENIIPFIGFYFLGSRICLVSPWMENGNLRHYLNKFPTTPRMPFIYDIVEGLIHLHDLDIVHCDLKAQNVLVSDDGRALIADFGISFVLTTTTRTRSTGGTSHFIAPEILLEESKAPTKTCDIWSFACLCYDVLTDKIPFYQYKDVRLICALMEKEIPLGPEQETEVGRHEINDKVWQLLVNCWNYIPKERPSCRAIQRTLMGIQGDQGTSSMGAGKPFRQDTTTADDFDRILWQSVELLNDDLNYQQVEEILRRVQNST